MFNVICYETVTAYSAQVMNGTLVFVLQSLRIFPKNTKIINDHQFCNVLMIEDDCEKKLANFELLRLHNLTASGLNLQIELFIILIHYILNDLHFINLYLFIRCSIFIVTIYIEP